MHKCKVYSPICHFLTFQKACMYIILYMKFSLPYCQRIQEFELFLLHKKRNFAHSVLFDYLSPYSAVFHDFYFQRDFLLCYCSLYTTLHKKQTFSLLNLEEFSSILKKNSRRKKSSLFLKATIHFDSSRTTSK